MSATDQTWFRVELPQGTYLVKTARGYIQTADRTQAQRFSKREAAAAVAEYAHHGFDAKVKPFAAE